LNGQESQLFFFLFYSFIGSALSKKLTDREEEEGRESGWRHHRSNQILIQHISELWFARMFGHKGEKYNSHASVK
jgi:hypothetical protein